jgi:tripartite-type tricarboxylate transporter receptor subunit TctC
MNKKSRLENIDMHLILFTALSAATAAAGAPMLPPYSAKPVRMIGAAAAGSGPDITARLVG